MLTYHSPIYLQNVCLSVPLLGGAKDLETGSKAPELGRKPQKRAIGSQNRAEGPHIRAAGFLHRPRLCWPMANTNPVINIFTCPGKILNL